MDWKLIFESMPHPAMVLDKDNNVLYANKILREKACLKSSRGLKEKCFELISRIKPCFICATHQVIKTKKPAKIMRYFEGLNVSGHTLYLMKMAYQSTFLNRLDHDSG